MNKTVEELRSVWQAAFGAMTAAPWNSTLAELEDLRMVEHLAWTAYRAVSAGVRPSRGIR